MPSDHIQVEACTARLKCFYLCLVLAQLCDPLMQRKTNVKQSNNGAGIYGAFLKEVLSLSNVEHAKHQLGQCSAHGPALNTGMSSAIDLKSDMHDMYTSARPFLCENWCHPALLDPSA